MGAAEDALFRLDQRSVGRGEDGLDLVAHFGVEHLADDDFADVVDQAGGVGDGTVGVDFARKPKDAGGEECGDERVVPERAGGTRPPKSGAAAPRSGNLPRAVSRATPR